MLSLTLFIFGLIFGSFANALVWRLKTEQTLGGRSMCPQCRATIRWYDNIPVLSFLWLRGKCRACRKPISWRYPVVELLMAIGFVFMGRSILGLPFESVDFWITLIFWCMLWFVLLVIAVFDWLYYEIPMVMLWIGLGCSVAFEAWRDWQAWHVWRSSGLWGWGDARLVWGLAAGIGAFAVFTLLSKGTKEHWMGWGDAWLVLLLGLVVSWPGILWAITIGSGVGSLLGVTMILAHRSNLQTRVPFAPLLILGFWLVAGMQLFG